MSDYSLGIETSGRVGSVALYRGRECITERVLEQQGRRHAQTLIAEVHSLLRANGVSARDCGLVAVSIGPGSFTGLRIGIVFAKTFAYATGCSVAAVDTLLSVAYCSPPDVSDVYVVSDAQRDELFVGRYMKQDDGSWQRLGDIAIHCRLAWAKDRVPSDVITGPAASKLESMSLKCRVLPEACWLPTASTIAAIGQRQAAAGELSDAWSLAPVYLRKSAAEEKWDAEPDGS